LPVDKLAYNSGLKSSRQIEDSFVRGATIWLTTAMETLAPGTGSGTLAKEVQIALGMALLRVPLMPDQVETSKETLVETAGEIVALLQNSKYDQAYPKFQALLKEYPSVPFLHYAYGTALAAVSEFDEAEIQLRAELQVPPGSERPYVSLVSVALKRHRPAEALASAQRAVQLAPESAESHYVLGRACLELGQDEQTVHELQTASKLAPGSPEVHFNLAKAYAKAKLPEKGRTGARHFCPLECVGRTAEELIRESGVRRLPRRSGTRACTARNRKDPGTPTALTLAQNWTLVENT
jgi:Flp pilus assembly protein TadD